MAAESVVVTCAFVYLLICLLCYGILGLSSHTKGRRIRDLNSLIVTAHPDDECMFFGPIINCLIGQKAACRLLCLSLGEYYKQGDVRRKELMKSCDVLGFQPSAVTIIEDGNLPDNPDIDWDPVVIAKYVEQQVRKHSINRIVTFDAYGVSGHRNHVSVFQAIQMLQRKSKKFKTEIEVLILKSESCFMKYLSIFSLPFIFICHLYTSSYIFLSSPLQVLRTQRAMVKHWSQLLWFRVLYILSSQYMFINNFHVLEE